MNKTLTTPYNTELKFIINNITASKESNTILFSKCTGHLSGQFMLKESNSRKTEEITKERENL